MTRSDLEPTPIQSYRLSPQIDGIVITSSNQIVWTLKSRGNLQELFPNGLQETDRVSSMAYT